MIPLIITTCRTDQRSRFGVSWVSESHDVAEGAADVKLSPRPRKDRNTQKSSCATIKELHSRLDHVK